MYKEFRKFLGPFDGGLVLNRSKYDVGANALIDGADVALDKEGRMTLRPGKRRIDTNAVTSYPSYGLFKAYLSGGTSYLVKIYNGKLAFLSTGDAFADVTAESDVSITSGNRYRFCVYNDVLYFTGGDAAYKWDFNASHKICKVGIAAPTITPAKNTDYPGGSMASGNYLYAFKFKNSVYGHESPFSPSATLATSVGGIVVDIGAQTIPPGADTLLIYRSEVGSTTLKYLGSTAYTGAAKTYIDGAADSSLGLPGDTDCDAPPSGAKYILSALNMIFLSGFSSYPNRVYYSRIGYPDYYMDESMATMRFLNVGRAEGDLITGMIYRNEKIYVFKTSSIWMISNPHNPHEVEINVISMRYGALSGDSISQDEKFIYFVSDVGVMVLDSENAVHRLSANVDPLFIGGGEDMISIDSRVQCCGVCHENRYLLSYSAKRRDKTGKRATAVTETVNNTGGNDSSATKVGFTVDYAEYTLLHSQSDVNKKIVVVVAPVWIKPAPEWESIQYVIYGSKDSKVSWKTLGTFTQYAIKNHNLDGWDVAPESSYSHPFYDGLFTDIRVEVLYDRIGPREGTPYSTQDSAAVNLVSVAYYYPETASFIPDSILCFHTDRVEWNPFAKQYTAVVSPIWNIGTRMFCLQNGGTDLNELLIADPAYNKTFQLTDGVGTDDGVAISGWFKTAQIWLKNLGLVNFVTMLALAGSGEATVEIFIDGKSYLSFYPSFAATGSEDLVEVREVLAADAEGRSVGLKVLVSADGMGDIVRFEVGGLFVPESL
jgi:hypothetical protein